MKKQLIAAAVAASFAVPAAAQVTVYGRFDMGYGKAEQTVSSETSSTKYTNTGFDGGVGGSRLGFRGAEDLGGGMKAGFVYEFGVDAGENVGIGSTRLGFAELGGGFGTFRVGRQVSPLKALADGFRQNGNNTNFTPGEFSSELSWDNRVANALTYMSPKLGGFSVSAQMADSNTTTTTKTSATLTNGVVSQTSNLAGSGSTAWSTTVQGEVQGLSIDYSAGPLALSVASHKQSIAGFTQNATGSLSASASVEIKDERMGVAASYDFGVAKVSFTRFEREQEMSGVKQINRELNEFGVTIPSGKFVYNVTYSDGTQDASASSTITAAQTKTDYSGYKARANYNISKRTAVYAQYGERESKVVSTGVKTTVDGYSLGLVHTF
jgi:predicted porin